jgi:hypothetical protein
MRVYQRILFLVIYSLVYAGLALENIGTEGKGTAIFLSALSTWVLVAIGVLLMSPELSSFRRILITVMIGAHYGVTLISILQTTVSDDGNFRHSWERSPWAVILAIVWYIVGQIVIWLFLFKSRRLHNSLP